MDLLYCNAKLQIAKLYAKNNQIFVDLPLHFPTPLKLIRIGISTLNSASTLKNAINKA